MEEPKSTMNVNLYNFGDLTMTRHKKAGLGISSKTMEFCFLANADSKSLEIRCDVLKLPKNIKELEKLKELPFKVVLTPELFKVFLEYIQETPRDKIEKKLKKLKTVLEKQEKKNNAFI